MRVLIDTNLLTRSAQPGHSQHADATGSIDALRRAGETLFVIPQVLYEFWAVATRPESANGLAMTAAVAAIELARVRRLFLLLPDTPDVLPAWEALVVAHDVKGKASHGARIAAAMQVHGVSHLLTFNIGDFTRFPHVTPLAPADVVAGA